MLSFQRMGESNSILRQSSASFLAMEKLLKDTSSTILTNVECSITEMVFNENSRGVEKEQSTSGTSQPLYDLAQVNKAFTTV